MRNKNDVFTKVLSEETTVSTVVTKGLVIGYEVKDDYTPRMGLVPAILRKIYVVHFFFWKFIFMSVITGNGKEELENDSNKTDNAA